MKQTALEFTEITNFAEFHLSASFSRKTANFMESVTAVITCHEHMEASYDLCAIAELPVLLTRRSVSIERKRYLE